MARGITRAVVQGLRRLLRGRRAPVAHPELEHAHWDRLTRRWLAHEDERQAV